jgi:hypothetical protein
LKNKKPDKSGDAHPKEYDMKISQFLVAVFAVFAVGFIF